MTKEYGILLMAAGHGRRYTQAGGGGMKLMQPLPDGQPVLAATLQHARRSGLSVHVVTRPEAAGIQQLCQAAGVSWSALASDGLGETIAAGVRACADWSGWLIQPGDMPFVPAESYRAVAQALRHHLTARMVWQQHPGHPVGFAAALRPALLALRGDTGGRVLLRQHPPYVIVSQHAGVIDDIDLPIAPVG